MSSRKLKLAILLLFSTIAISQAQAIWSKTWNAGDTEYTNRIKSSHLINDTLYYSTFNACNVIGQVFTECMTLGKMDKSGDIVREVLYEDIRMSEQGQIPWRIIGDFIFIGEGSAKSSPANYKIHKLTKDLELLNTDEYKLDYPTDQLFITGFEEYKDYYILSGITQVKDTSIYPDILVWIDKETMMVDTIVEYPFEKDAVIPRLLFVGQDSLLTYYFSGLRVNGNNNSRGFVKIGTNKNIVFHYLDKIDLSTNHQYEHSGLLMKNGKMIYKQRYNSSEQPWPGTWKSDFDILCINEGGQIEWRFNMPGSSYTGAALQFDGTKTILHMTETADGDILACGTTNWHFNYPTIFEYNWLTDTLPPFPDILETYEAPYIIKLDGDTGELIWQYAIIDYDEYGNIAPYALRQVHELSDGSIMGSGWSTVRDANGNYIKDNSWAIRLPADGCISEDDMECGYETYLSTSTDEPTLIDMTAGRPFNLYPNPSNGFYMIKNHRATMSSFMYEVFDMQGQLISKKMDSDAIDITDEPSGIYLCKIFDADGKLVQVERLVKSD